MQPRPVLVLDAHWREIDELFSAADLQQLHESFTVVWGRDEPIPADVLEQALPEASVLIAASPRVDADTLSRAPRLSTVIEVSGAFPDSIDYALCERQGVQVLSCAPGFRESVAEMALAMVLSGARGLTREHEHFRQAEEHWLNDKPDTDFTLFDSTVGFIGYGSIARATHELLKPFRVSVSAHDPWIDATIARQAGVELLSLHELMQQCRVVFVCAAPTRSNHQMIDREALSHMQKKALLVVISRAHLVDFEAVVDAAQQGDIRLAIDVFPEEPLPAEHRLRQMPDVILSPHRAAAIKGGRQLIGRMIVSDLHNLLQGLPERSLQKACLQHVSELSSVDDAHKVAVIAADR